MSEFPPQADTAGEVAPDPEREVLLGDHVRSALLGYFSRLDGHTVSDLYEMVMTAVERPLLQTVLEHYGYNQSKAAMALGLSRSTLRKKIHQHGLE